MIVWVKELLEVVVVLNNEVISLIGKRLIEVIKEKINEKVFFLVFKGIYKVCWKKKNRKKGFFLCILCFLF